MIDAFADVQTAALAEKTTVVGYSARGFDADALLGEIHQLDANQFVGCVYGSGFEAQPELLQRIAEIIPLIGNSAETVAAVKNASKFFAVLKQLKIPHPSVLDVLPVSSVNDGSVVYLKKNSGGSGGTHITQVSANEISLLDNEYYQQQLSGRSVSLLFMADGREVEPVGFNEQWLSPWAKMPFRYGGAVSRIVLDSSVQQQLIAAAKKLTMAFDLLGLNSLDAIVQEGTVYVLEVNPRLSATVDLYGDIEENLIDRHVQVCLARGGLNQAKVTDESRVAPSKAHAIVYATMDTEIAASFAWPGAWLSWLVDVPNHSGNSAQPIKIPAGDPICTVIACAEGAEVAKQLACARVELVLNLFKVVS